MKSQPIFFNKRILLGITGGIAAYKNAELVRLLKEAGADVRVVMTQAATEFVTPTTLQALSGHRVYQTQWDIQTQAAMPHIDLARWADTIIIAPATANFIAKMSMGMADDLLSTLCLATASPLFVAPAMNKQMWQHAATQDNILQLKSRDVHILGPDAGEQACGDIGMGRMLEPEDIIKALFNYFHQTQYLSGKHIIITAGPTQEAIDPVRYISNYSSGKMGYAIAAAAAQAGAEVLLVSGPTALPCPTGVHRIDVTSAQEMHNVVMAHIANCNIFIGVAAVADYRLDTVSTEKIKKSSATLQLKLTRNPDILAAVAHLNPRPLVVGFAAETHDIVKNAKKKLQEKKLDIIIANDVSNGKGFNCDQNELIVITKKNVIDLPLTTKQQLAKNLISLIIEHLNTETLIP